VSEPLTLWHVVQVGAWVITALLSIGAVLLRAEMTRLSRADVALTEAITKLTAALAAFEAHVPKEYVAKTDMQLYVQNQANEMRGMRTEVSELRREMGDHLTSLRDTIVRLITEVRREPSGKD